jgi:hypothetical protein
MRDLGERDSGKGNRNPVLKSQAATPKLSDLGISTQSSRWQELARISDDTFEAKVTSACGPVAEPVVPGKPSC